MGLRATCELPIYIAGLSPKMLRLAGEVADGVMLWLCNPEYIRDVVVPEVTAGRERAGKGLEGFDIVAAVPAAVTDDRAARLRDHARRPDHLLEPAVLPRDDRALGLRRRHRAFDAGMEAGDPDKARTAISDGFLEDLTAIGPPDEVRAGVERYREAGATSPCIGPVPAPTSQPRWKQPPRRRLPTANRLNFVADLAPCTTLNYVTDGVTDSQHRVKPPRAMDDIREPPATPPPPAALSAARTSRGPSTAGGLGR